MGWDCWLVLASSGLLFNLSLVRPTWLSVLGQVCWFKGAGLGLIVWVSSAGLGILIQVYWVGHYWLGQLGQICCLGWMCSSRVWYAWFTW